MKPVWKSKTWWGAVLLALIGLWNATAKECGCETPQIPLELAFPPAGLAAWGVRDAIRKSTGT